jgi:5-methylcytosine-specific restriction protein B
LQFLCWCEDRGLTPSVLDLIEARVGTLNVKIASAVSLGPHFRIGHSYVTPDHDERVDNGRSWFRRKVESEIGPLLDEYWYDAPEIATKARSDLLLGL